MSESQTFAPLSGGCITDVKGWRAAGVACGIKKNGALDLALLVSDRPASCAGVFTTNRFQAAPVLYDREAILADPRGVRAVVANSGCANACTGPEGLEDVREMARLAGRAAGVDANRVLVMSTGVIGQRLPMRSVAHGVELAAAALSADGGHAAARAIMTTDTHPKEVAARLSIEGREVTVAGMAKGAGMISPNMATLLVAVATDASVAPGALDGIIRYAADRSFNCVTVDGDMSTNDTFLLLANGAAGGREISGPQSEGYQQLRDAVTYVATELAKMVAFDGEGATKHVTVHVTGARNRAEARQVAMTVAKSPLVKTAIYGKDANWGRIVCAVGYSGVEVEPEAVDMWLGDLHLVHNGRPFQVDEERASQILAETDVAITIALGMGDADVTVWTCDLSHEYVSINANYRT